VYITAELIIIIWLVKNKTDHRWSFIDVLLLFQANGYIVYFDVVYVNTRKNKCNFACIYGSLKAISSEYGV